MTAMDFNEAELKDLLTLVQAKLDLLRGTIGPKAIKNYFDLEAKLLKALEGPEGAPEAPAPTGPQPATANEIAEFYRTAWNHREGKHMITEAELAEMDERLRVTDGETIIVAWGMLMPTKADPGTAEFAMAKWFYSKLVSHVFRAFGVTPKMQS